MLVIADRFACAFEMTAVVAVATIGLKKLLAFDGDWDEATLREVRQRQTTVMSGCRDDLDASLKLMACWDEVSSAGEAFVQSVKLLLPDGDGFSKELWNAAPAKDRRNTRKLLETVRNSLIETEVNTAADELLGTIRDKKRWRDLKKRHRTRPFDPKKLSTALAGMEFRLAQLGMAEGLGERRPASHAC